MVPGVELTSLEKQQASLRTQRESVQKQLSIIRPRAPQSTARIALKNIDLEFSPAAFDAFEMPSLPWQSAASIDCPPIARPEADSLISSAAKREDLSPALLRAVIKRESAFHPCAVSEKGALGLMQLMPATAEQFGVDDPFDPKQNIRGGAAFLKQLLNRFGGDIRMALGAYNAGPEKVAAAGGIPAISETQDYVTNIAADLGLPNLSVQPAVEMPDTPSTPEIRNAMTKPDLRHLTLPAPNLTLLEKPTPVHLVSGQ